MSTLVWDEMGKHYYEGGVSHGVLYLSDGSGVPWNGLTSVEEKVNNGIDPTYFDGVKFNDVVTLGDFSATLKAYTYPLEFLEYEGYLEDQKGVYVAGQMPGRFGLSYRTAIGNDIDGNEHGYKLHILYNLTAIPSDRAYETLSLDSTPSDFEWDISSIPEPIDNYRPTAHVIFDTRRINLHLLSDIEAILYGDGTEPARLPSLKGLFAFIHKWNRLIITDNGDGTWTATANEEGIIEMLDPTTFQITTDTAHYLDPFTYTIESSNKNEEDV